MIDFIGTITGFTQLVLWASAGERRLKDLEANAAAQIERLQRGDLTAAELEVIICGHAQCMRDVRALSAGYRLRLFNALHILQAEVDGRRPDREAVNRVGD